MKNKIWILQPYLIIFSAIMWGMSLLSLKFNFIVFVVEFLITIISIGVVVLISLRFKNYVKSIVISTVKNFTDVDENYLEGYKFPAVVVGVENEIVWYNSSFQSIAKNSGNIFGTSIAEYTDNIPLSDIINNSGTDIKYGEKTLMGFGHKMNACSLVYFIDITHFKQLEDECRLSKPVVAIVVLDNREDFISDNEEESEQVILQVETTLQRWAAEYNALYRKVSGNRYFICFEERDIQILVSTKFKILDQMREINFNGRAATISAGIGRSGSTIKESELQARKALDMALGRGGDQVAVFENEEYKFFGGVEREVEKRNRVRARVIAETIEKAILYSDKVIIMGHCFSDFDCVGASIGLYGIVSKMFDKPCFIVNDYDKTLARPLIDKYTKEINKNVFFTESGVIGLITAKTLLIIVDTHSPDFLESKNIYKKCKNIVVIDHHRKLVNHINNAIVFYHEPSASSASEMCTEIINYLGDKTLNKGEAEALMAGIMLDTKNFVIKTGIHTFESATYLKRKGADTIAVKSLFADNIITYKEQYKLSASAEIYDDCAIASCDEIIKNARVIAAKTADSLLSLKEIIASFVIFKTEDKRINISARSYGRMNVQIIMEALGGGGHMSMAAVQLENTTVEEAKTKLKDAILEHKKI